MTRQTWKSTHRPTTHSFFQLGGKSWLCSNSSRSVSLWRLTKHLLPINRIQCSNWLFSCWYIYICIYIYIYTRWMLFHHNSVNRKQQYNAANNRSVSSFVGAVESTLSNSKTNYLGFCLCPPPEKAFPWIIPSGLRVAPHTWKSENYYLQGTHHLDDLSPCFQYSQDLGMRSFKQRCVHGTCWRGLHDMLLANQKVARNKSIKFVWPRRGNATWVSQRASIRATLRWMLLIWRNRRRGRASEPSETENQQVESHIADSVRPGREPHGSMRLSLRQHGRNSGGVVSS